MDASGSLAAALDELRVSDRSREVLAEHPGRRLVVRVEDVVVKAFAEAERDAWEREVAGLRIAAARGLAPSPPRFGELWSAIPWLDGVVPMRGSVDEREMHRSLGASLAALHGLPATGLPGWPLAARLRTHLHQPPSPCPQALARDVAQIVEPLLGLAAEDRFVHGDWGTANVLIADEASTEVLAVIDFEDSHIGDAAEDFKWQLLAGVESEQYLAMAEGYQAAGGQLGLHAVERLTVAGVELCMDVLGWQLPPREAERFHGRCLATLGQIVDGERPTWSGR